MPRIGFTVAAISARSVVGAALARREVNRSILADCRDFSFRRSHRFVKSLAALIGFPPLLQGKKLFQRLRRRAAHQRAVYHCHGGCDFRPDWHLLNLVLVVFN